MTRVEGVYENPLTDEIAYKVDPMYVSEICCTVNVDVFNEIAAGPPLNLNVTLVKPLVPVDTDNALQYHVGDVGFKMQILNVRVTSESDGKLYTCTA